MTTAFSVNWASAIDPTSCRDSKVMLLYLEAPVRRSRINSPATSKGELDTMYLKLTKQSHTSPKRGNLATDLAPNQVDPRCSHRSSGWRITISPPRIYVSIFETKVR
jgi:hypothetical protein